MPKAIPDIAELADGDVNLGPEKADVEIFLLNWAGFLGSRSRLCELTPIYKIKIRVELVR